MCSCFIVEFGAYYMNYLKIKQKKLLFLKSEFYSTNFDKKGYFSASVRLT